MKKVTEKNLRKFIQMKEEYLKTRDQDLLREINDFTENVINLDKKYYSKLSSYNFSSEELEFLM